MSIMFVSNERGREVIGNPLSFQPLTFIINQMINLKVLRLSFIQLIYVNIQFLIHCMQ